MLRVSAPVVSQRVGMRPQLMTGRYCCMSRPVAVLVDRENGSQRVIVDDEEDKRNK